MGVALWSISLPLSLSRSPSSSLFPRCAPLGCPSFQGSFNRSLKQKKEPRQSCHTPRSGMFVHEDTTSGGWIKVQAKSQKEEKGGRSTYRTNDRGAHGDMVYYCTCLISGVVKVQRCSFGPERGGIKGDVHGAEIIIPSPTVLVPEHQADLVWHRLHIEIKVKGGVPDGVQ